MRAATDGEATTALSDPEVALLECAAEAIALVETLAHAALLVGEEAPSTAREAARVGLLLDALARAAGDAATHLDDLLARRAAARRAHLWGVA